MYELPISSRRSSSRRHAVITALVVLGLLVMGAGPATATTDLNTDWTLHTPPEANSWRGVAYGNDRFVAVSDDGTNRVMTSSDGVNWTAQPAAQTNKWQAIAFGGGRFVAVSNDGANRVMSSTNGTGWTQPNNPVSSGSWFAITYGNGTFVAVGNGGAVMTSTNGSDWTSGSAPSKTWRAVTYLNSKFVAVTSTATDQYQAMTSTDGLTWDNTNTTLDPKSNWDGITAGDGKYVALASGGPGVLSMWSENGTAWSAGSTPGTNREWTAGIYANDQFIAVSDDAGVDASVMRSLDGATWTEQTTPAVCRWTSITFGAGKYVAVGDYNTNAAYTCGSQLVMTSDAITPTPPSPTPQTTDGCVTPGNKHSIPRRGTKQLMTANCVTNADQAVAVKLTSGGTRKLASRGDMRNARLYCKSTGGTIAKTVPSGYGAGYRTCSDGSLRIRTYGQRQRLVVTWFAPETTGYSAYRKSQRYVT